MSSRLIIGELPVPVGMPLAPGCKDFAHVCGRSLIPVQSRPSASSALRAAEPRSAGSPQPPPPPDSTWMTLPDGTTTLTSLLFSFRGAPAGASSV